MVGGNTRMLVLHTATSRVGAMDVDATCEGGIDEALSADTIINMGADEMDIPAGPFVIYVGSHGDRGAHRADIILPSAAYTEEPGIFVNTEGRPQLALRAGFPPGEAKENWAILRALSGELGNPLNFDSMEQLRYRLATEHGHIEMVDQVMESEWAPVEAAAAGDAPLRSPIADFYRTNPIARASEVMAELSRNAAERRAAPLAAE